MARNDLYSDAMDAAMTAYTTQQFFNRKEPTQGEEMMRKAIAAAIDAYVQESK